MNFNFDEVIQRRGTSSIKWDCMAQFLNIDGHDLIPMWVSDYDFRAPPSVLRALEERVRHGVFGYSERNEAYFSAFIDWYKRKHRITIDRQSIATIQGVLPGIALILQIISQENDKIVLQTPGYGAFASIVNLNERQVVTNPLVEINREYHMDLDHLETCLQSGAKAVLLCNPHNPLGRIWQRAELEQVALLCERYDAWLISDEIWGDLCLPGNEYVSALNLDQRFHQRLIVATSSSKTFGLSSLRISNFIIANQHVREHFIRKMSAQGLDVYNALAMHAATTAYQEGEDWLNQLMGYLQSNIDYLQQHLANQLPHIHFHTPQAGYLVWLDCRALNLDDEQLKQRFISSGLVPSMGSGFIEGGTGFVRLNLGCPRATLEAACQRLTKALSLA